MGGPGKDELSEALFRVDGDAYVPGPLCRGPWDEGHCHGGPVAALIARAVEALDRDEPWQVARLTVELQRPMLIGTPVEVRTVVERPGRKVSLIGISVVSGSGEVARARVLRIRDAAVDVSDAETLSEPAMAPPASGRPEVPDFASGVSFAGTAMEHRVVAGSWVEAGPMDVWMRLTVPLLAGEELTGLQRTVAAADFGNGLSRLLPWESHVFINPEVTIHIGRQPRGEWIGLRSVSHYGPRGVGFAESALFDEGGRVGRAVQSLMIDTR